MPQLSPVRPLKAYLVLLFIVVAAATGPIVIRQAQRVGLPSLYIIAARLTLASVIMAPIVFHRNGADLRRLSRNEWAMLAAASFFFALNLLLLFLSLEFASVLVTSVLRRTSPLWVIWLEIIFLGAVFTRQVWMGLSLTLIGSALVGLGGSGAVEAGSNPLLGALLALIGSVSIGLYLLIGRKFSFSLPSLAYSWLVFSGAALIAIAAVFLTGTPVTGYGLNGLVWVIVVTFVTQLLGHIPINLSLKYFHATYISITMQVAIVLSAFLAFLFFNEVPSLVQVIGSIVIAGGVLLVSWK